MNEAGADGADGGGAAEGNQGGENATDNQEGSTNDNSNSDGGDNGAGGASDEITLTDEQISELKLKYINDETGEMDLHKLFTELHGKQSESTAPESYANDFLGELSKTEDFQGWEFDVENDPLIKTASEWAKNNGVSQEKYETLITDTMKQVKEVQIKMEADQRAAMQEEWKTVEDADARKQKTLAQLSAQVPAEFHDHVKALMETPATFKMMEAMAAKMRGPSDNFESQQISTPTISREDINVWRSQRDKAEQEGDRALVNQLQSKIDNGYNQLEKLGLLS